MEGRKEKGREREREKRERKGTGRREQAPERETRSRCWVHSLLPDGAGYDLSALSSPSTGRFLPN